MAGRFPPVSRMLAAGVPWPFPDGLACANLVSDVSLFSCTRPWHKLFFAENSSSITCNPLSCQAKDSDSPAVSLTL